MANYATLKAAIQNVVKTNGNNEITGALLQQTLLTMVNSLGNGFQYMGVATPTTNPGTPDQNVFYIASESGTYSNFSGLTVADGEIAIFKYNGTWIKEATGAATIAQVTQLGQKVNQLDANVFGGEFLEEYETISDSFFNTSVVTVGSHYSVDTPSPLAGTNCLKLQVSAGEKYYIQGKGITNATALCVVCDNSDIVLQKILADSRSDAEIINIETPGVLYVNLYQFSAQTDSVKKSIVVENGIEQRMQSAENDIIEIEREINGEDVEVETPCQLTQNSFFNTNVHFTDGSTTYSVQSPSALNGCYCLKKSCVAGEKYLIHHKNGSTSAVGLYIYTDLSGFIISSKQNSEDETVIISEDGYLYVNLYNYDATTDYVKQVVVVHRGGFEEYVRQEVNTLKGLYGGKLVCFGDSITEFKDASGKSYPDYLAEIYNAEVIGCGIGGTRLAQRTSPVVNPSSVEEGYAGLDIINLVRAACNVMFDNNTPFSTVVENAAIYIKNTAQDDNTEIVQRLLGVDWNTVDGVIVFAGTNDWNNGVGHWGESGSNDASTTMGAINEIIRLLLSTYKHLKLYWFTPIVRWLDYSGGTGSDNGWSDVNERSGAGQTATLKQFSHRIQEEVSLNHIPVCDLYNTLGINKSNFSQYFNDNDGTHPAKGYRMLAMKIASFIIANKTF